MKHFNYKGYTGTIEIDIEDNILYGKIAYIRDLVTYQAATVKELEAEFRESVDIYLRDCEELNKKPDIPFKGVFNVRVAPATHRHIAELSEDLGMSINSFVNKALENEILRAEQSR